MLDILPRCSLRCQRGKLPNLYAKNGCREAIRFSGRLGKAVEANFSNKSSSIYKLDILPRCSLRYQRGKLSNLYAKNGCREAIQISGRLGKAVEANFSNKSAENPRFSSSKKL